MVQKVFFDIMMKTKAVKNSVLSDLEQEKSILGGKTDDLSWGSDHTPTWNVLGEVISG